MLQNNHITFPKPVHTFGTPNDSPASSFSSSLQHCSALPSAEIFLFVWETRCNQKRNVSHAIILTSSDPACASGPVWDNPQVTSDPLPSLQLKSFALLNSHLSGKINLSIENYSCPACSRFSYFDEKLLQNRPMPSASNAPFRFSTPVNICNSAPEGAPLCIRPPAMPTPYSA